jgi:hypothetical protein
VLHDGADDCSRRRRNRISSVILPRLSKIIGWGVSRGSGALSIIPMTRKILL